VPVDVHVVTPDREVWSGDADIVVARGVDGEVGIQRGHVPLLVQLAIGSFRARRPDGVVVAAVVDGGFLHVTGNGETTRVDVLASQAQLADEIDVVAARRTVEELERRLASRDAAGDDDELLTTRTALAKARARVALIESPR